MESTQKKCWSYTKFSLRVLGNGFYYAATLSDSLTVTYFNIRIHMIIIHWLPEVVFIN